MLLLPISSSVPCRSHRYVLLSAFMFFSNAKRNEIKVANPDASFGDIVSI